MMTPTLTAAVIMAKEELMRWFKTKDGTVYPDPSYASQTSTSTGLEYSTCEKETDKKLRQEVFDLRNLLLESRNHVLHLQQAIGSLVLRLKVIDLDEMEKELGKDGLVPMRLSLVELRRLVEAYDNKRSVNPLIPDYGLGADMANTTVADYTGNYSYTYTTNTTTDPWGKS